MNINYIMAILYAYPELDAEVDYINTTIEKKIFNSNRSKKNDAWETCVDILDLIERRNKMVYLKAKIDKVLWSFGDDDFCTRALTKRNYLDRVFFHLKDVNRHPFDILWVPTVKDFGERLGFFGFTDEKLEKEYLYYDLFKKTLYYATTREFDKVVNKNRVVK